MGRGHRRQMRIADFFFAFDEEFEAERQLAVDGLIDFDRVDAGHEIALVVGHAAGEQLAIPHGGLEGRAVPQLHRVGRLHVVMTVQEQALLPTPDLAPNDRWAIPGIPIRHLASRFLQTIAHPLRHALQVGHLFGHRGNRAGFRQFRKKTVCVFFDVGLDFVLCHVRVR